MIYNSTNIEDISNIINNPKVYKWVSDDLSPEVFVPVIHPAILYLMNEEKTGVIQITPINGITCQVHTSVLPELFGKAVDFVKEATNFGFDSTRYMKAITFIPEYNKLAIRLAVKSGMKKEGCIKKSFLKNWVLYNQFIYGFTKKEFKGALLRERTN